MTIDDVKVMKYHTIRPCIKDYGFSSFWRDLASVSDRFNDEDTIYPKCEKPKQIRNILAKIIVL